MTRSDDTQPYRGIEFGVHDEGNDIWFWAYYPKTGEGVAKRGQVKGSRDTAIAACKVAIDKWLGPKNSN